jgi:hypothetical protein
MSKHISVTRFLSAVLLLDLVLLVAVSVTGAHVDMFLEKLLPGTFGPSMGPHMTGNHLLCALLLFVDSLLFLAAGFLLLLGAAGHGLMIGASGFARLLKDAAGLSREDITAASFAVAEEQKAEIRRVHTGRNLMWIGAVLLLLAFPAVCFTYAQADIGGQPLLQDAGGTIANAALSVEDAVVFAADQLADAVLLDVPRVFQWHLSSLQPGHHHTWLRPFVLLYRILDKLVVLASIFAVWRGGHLRAYVLQMAGNEAVPVSMNLRDTPLPMFRDIRSAVEDRAALPPETRPEPQPPLEVHPPEEQREPEPAAAEAPVHAAEADSPPPEQLPEPEETQAPVPVAPTLEVPVYVEPAHSEEAEPYGAPLALHELKSPPEQTAAENGETSREDGGVSSPPHKNAELPVREPEFDA